jgi:hypothetical protein
MHRVDGHPELAGVEAEAEGVVRPADDAVVVEVEPGRDAGVRLRREAVRVVDRRGAVLRDREVVVLEEAERDAARVVVELVDQDDVRPDALDRLGGVPRLRVRRRGEVGDQPVGRGAVERRVEGGEADVRLRAAG